MRCTADRYTSAPQPAPTTGDEREAFEAWAKKEGYDLRPSSIMGYLEEETRDAWEGWQARAAHRREDQRDSARLDWLMGKVCCDDIEEIDPLPFGVSSKAEHLANFRAAIDAAMQRTAAPAQTDTEK